MSDITVVYHIDVDKILQARGLGHDKQLQQETISMIARLMDPYVPMAAGQSGPAKNRAEKREDGILYPGPHSRFLYYGKVMVGIESRSAYAKLGEKKVVTPKDLEFHGAPMRGPFWDRRMWADRKDDVLSYIEKRTGGKRE